MCSIGIDSRNNINCSMNKTGSSRNKAIVVVFIVAVVVIVERSQIQKKGVRLVSY